MEVAFLPMTQPPEPALLPSNLRERVIRLHLRGIWRFLRLLGCAPDEADDLAQETFVVALRKGTGDRSAAETGAFLRKTARHLFLRSREKQGRRAVLLAEAADHLWARTCADDGGDRAVAALRECVAELGRRARQVVHLFYGEGCSRGEVADALRMKEAGVKTALQRVRSTLRECMRRKMS